MKKFAALLIALSITLSLSGCMVFTAEDMRDNYNYGYSAGYDNGYDDGHEEGYEDGYYSGKMDDEDIICAVAEAAWLIDEVTCNLEEHINSDVEFDPEETYLKLEKAWSLLVSID